MENCSKSSSWWTALALRDWICPFTEPTLPGRLSLRARPGSKHLTCIRVRTSSVWRFRTQAWTGQVAN